MNTLRNIWISIRRNPVIVAFVTAALVQFAQDYVANDIDWAHFASYAAMLCFGIAARMFTVPASEHETTIANLHRAIEFETRKGDAL